MGSRHRRLLPILISIFMVSALCGLRAQDTRFYRVYFVDKGTSDRVLLPSDPLYEEATEHLTPRALRRRSKVLHPDSIVSTADLPVYEPYRLQLLELGVEIAQTSRWLNSAMIRTDSATFEVVRTQPYISSSEIVRTIPKGAVPIGKLPPPLDFRKAARAQDDRMQNGCIFDAYGLADRQNREIGLDKAHSLGFAGEGVLVGILDAGFDWRSHEALKNARVIAEYDFVNRDGNTADEPGQTPSESHGTLVMSIIGGWLENEFIGGAPRAMFALAKTEDVASERHVEEDNFVAGLEWLEALGVDVTNTSLGYTTFDEPEQGHPHEELDGRTAFASRGVNHAAGLGVICVLAAGNEARSYRYVSVPAEADSAIAVAALNVDGTVANFSSRGFGDGDRVKPDVAAPGVEVYGAEAGDPLGFVAQQGTSLASPMVASAVAVLLSADPELTPWEIREALTGTASQASDPDTAVGYGMIRVDRALGFLSDDRQLAGAPVLLTSEGSISVASWIVGDDPTDITNRLTSTTTDPLTLVLENLRTGAVAEAEAEQPHNGLAGWILPKGASTLGIASGDSIALSILAPESGQLLRTAILHITDNLATPISTLCDRPPLPVTTIATSRPNPFYEASRIEFTIDESADVSLDLFNSLGEHVRSFINGKRYDAGYYSILFSPTDLPGGAYYYRLKVNDDVYSEQMIYLR